MNRRGWADAARAVDQDARVLRSRRVLPASALALAAVLLTAGCTTGQGGAATPTPSGTAAGAATPSTGAAPLACAEPGPQSDAVEVTDEGEGKEPRVEFPVPTTATATQRTVITKGDGETIEQGRSVGVAYAIYDAKTGKKLDTAGYGSTAPRSFPVDPAQVLAGIPQALVCTAVGERFAAVIPASAAFGDTGSEQLGVGGGDSLVFVGDVVDLTPTKADGTAKDLPDGFPEVTLADDGKPTVRIPSADPPAELEIATRQVGDGETVREGDSVTVQYQGVLWRTGEVFDQSWGRGPTTFGTGQVVKGFGKALVGAKVGSQVVAIIPPSEGYGENGTPDGSITATDTMVFVIDVLGTSRPS